MENNQGREVNGKIKTDWKDSTGFGNQEMTGDPGVSTEVAE